VPSGLLSSTTSTFKSGKGSEKISENNLGMFSASLYVGMIRVIFTEIDF
jgi:hypothetical protein